MLKDRLAKVENDFGQDRKKMATALSGLDEEMAGAKERLHQTCAELENEKKKVNSLMATQAEEKRVLEEKMQGEKKMLEEELSMYRQDLSKSKQEIEAYDEAVKMLQSQVDILTELADAAEANKSEPSEGNEDTEVTEDTDDATQRKAKEEAKKEINDACKDRARS